MLEVIIVSIISFPVLFNLKHLFIYSLKINIVFIIIDIKYIKFFSIKST